ncbi:MAG: TonB-dependent receptor [Novosphingobium sp.]|nr:TonB-dependent receptor [Novosphingobium sp.]
MKNRIVSALLATSALSIAVPAYAQDADENAADTGAIVVTGTRIVRDGYTAPTPVTVATTEDLAKSTPSSIPDALNKLPQFQNSLSPSKSANNFANFPIHGNILNLRGLGTPTNNPKGPLRTMIMFDDIRVPATTYVGTVDTNVIPNLLINRVDVVTGGASAAYGSDAVAGVVNFVLDKEFTGIRGVAQAGISQRGDNANQRLGIAAGTPFAGDRGHALVSLEYFNADGMLRSDRAIGNRSLTFVGSVPGGGAPGTAGNPYIARENVRIAANNDIGQIVSSNVAGFPWGGYVTDGNGNFRPFNHGETTGTPAFEVGGDGYTIPAKTAAIAPYETYQGFGRLSYDLTDDWNVYVQGIYSRTNMSYRALGNSLVTPVTIYKGNPFIPASLDALMTGDDASVVFRQYTPQNPAPHVKERTDFWMATGGVEGSLGNFKVNVSYTHGESKHKVAQAGLYDWRNLFAAVDAVTDPATGAPTCRVLLDPAYASQYAGCVPMNVFAGAPSVSSPEGYAYATGTSRYTATLKHDSIVGIISGSLFELPAGPVDIAVGAEYRKQSLKLTTNADPAMLDDAAERSAYFSGLRGVAPGVLYYWLTNVGVADGSLNVKEAFAEVAVPVLADTPGFQELSLNGAIRMTDYSFSGTVTTWKIGGTWKPIDDLLLRGVYSRDIRAPNLYELFRGDSSGIGIVLDPVTGINQNIPTVSGGNTNLKPEKAKTLSFGGVLTPSFLPGFSLAVDYYRIRMKGAIDSLSSTQIINNCYEFGPDTPECDLITRPAPDQFPTLVRISEANISFLNTSGIDFDASYRTGVGNNGALGIRLYATRLLKFNTQLYAGQPVLNYAGVNVVSSNPVSYPKWRGSLSIDYNVGPFGVTVSEQYIGKMTLGIPGGNETFVDPKVKAVAYTDLSLRWKIEQDNGDFEFFTTINNLFDKKPPLIPSTVPGVNLPTNISTYDVVGRAFTAGVRFKL